MKWISAKNPKERKETAKKRHPSTCRVNKNKGRAQKSFIEFNNLTIVNNKAPFFLEIHTGIRTRKSISNYTSKGKEKSPRNYLLLTSPTTTVVASSKKCDLDFAIASSWRPIIVVGWAMGGEGKT